LMGYGLSAIVYFSLEFFAPFSMPSAVSKGIFYSNIANSIATVCAVYAFLYFFDNHIRLTWAKYAILVVVTFCFVYLFQIFVGIFYWNQIGIKDFSKNTNSGSYLYMLLPATVSCIYFFFWQRNRQITRKISEQEYQLLNLEKLKTKAQLNALEARINPHFLYNSLNSIAGLVHQDPDKAEEMTIQLSKLFRYTTGRNEGHSHTITEELEVVKSYLAIEQMRFGNRLQFTIEVSPALFEVKIPRFLLQPLVENAIKHGISQLLEHGIIEIKIVQVADFIEFRIHDNGPAFKEEMGGGYGLRSIRDKLDLIYHSKASLQIQNSVYKAVIISLPVNHEWVDFK
jgi:two-component system, LytTR family, sensor kinase